MEGSKMVNSQAAFSHEKQNQIHHFFHFDAAR